jgi:hypothetical protein
MKSKQTDKTVVAATPDAWLDADLLQHLNAEVLRLARLGACQMRGHEFICPLLDADHRLLLFIGILTVKQEKYDREKATFPPRYVEQVDALPFPSLLHGFILAGSKMPVWNGDGETTLRSYLAAQKIPMRYRRPAGSLYDAQFVQRLSQLSPAQQQVFRDSLKVPPLEIVHRRNFGVELEFLHALSPELLRDAAAAITQIEPLPTLYDALNLDEILGFLCGVTRTKAKFCAQRDETHQKFAEKIDAMPFLAVVRGCLHHARDVREYLLDRVVQAIESAASPGAQKVKRKKYLPYAHAWEERIALVPPPQQLALRASLKKPYVDPLISLNVYLTGSTEVAPSHHARIFGPRFFAATIFEEFKALENNH